MSKILITGGSGKLGKALVALFPQALHPTHAELDISEQKPVFEYIKKHEPDVIIHTAALTGIRECEDDKKKAWAYNVVGTENLINACIENGLKTYFMYVSSACVFDGHRGFYTEEDLPDPENYYALTKLLGEFVVKKLTSNYLIIRTNFVAKEPWRFPKAFADRFGTYLFAEGVAEGIKDVMNEKMTGIVHICGDKKLSMLELARLTTPSVGPMTLKEYVGPKLTVDMTLNTIRWKQYKIA